MDAITDQSINRSSSVRSSKLRYPLRSAAKTKDLEPEMVDASNTSASKRGKPTSMVSQSVSVLDLSGKAGPAKPPRRLSIPTKSAAASPCPATFGSITPISEARTRRSNAPGKSDTPASDVSRSTASRPKFSTISSVSYWLTQIKLAEAASKQSIVVGFFKLALESGCEPLDRMRQELKVYVSKHDLATELEDSVKDLLQIYNIEEDLEQLKISESKEEKKSEKNVRSASATTRNGNLKPKSLNSDTLLNIETSKKENLKKGQPASRIRGSYNTNPAKEVSVKDLNGNHTMKKPQKQRRGNESGKGNKPTTKPESVDVLSNEVSHEDKENMGAQLLMVAATSEEI
ncbi:uncharacterized protein [Typha latifolia]|uniref:uncharacterized protein n=1 Tax=Typha latifolia TaxID=4733 RepID=UPI003C2C5381